MWSEFKEFAIKGNALDLAVGVVIGAAFTAIVNSMVGDIFNPIIGVISGKVDFGRWTIGLPGTSVLRIGSFINAIINFLIVSFAVFLMIKQINRFRRHPSKVRDTKQCPYCLSTIPMGAVRCSNCTSELK